MFNGGKKKVREVGREGAGNDGEAEREGDRERERELG